MTIKERLLYDAITSAIKSELPVNNLVREKLRDALGESDKIEDTVTDEDMARIKKISEGGYVIPIIGVDKNLVPDFVWILSKLMKFCGLK